jgi:hypothetical protein
MATSTQQVPQELTQQQALELLVSGVQAAQRKGSYNLDEAELLARACRVFVRQTPQPAQETSTPSTQEGLQTPVPQPPQSSQQVPPVNDPQNVQTI